MKVYRISREKYIRDLSGEGARRFGGRWNKRGVPVIYTSSQESLAALEVLANTPLSSLPDDLYLITLILPESIKIMQIKSPDLPKGWNRYPPPNYLREAGSEWLISRNSLAMRIPSALINSEFNILLNPIQKEMSQIKTGEVRSFRFDQRILS
jgi:RES domain-containing protein